ncbi:hypothetical protein M8J76_001035 [Diaphorina citri]|nr:hypothetical protein M8J76_001035 [Diaphorina citri]
MPNIQTLGENQSRRTRTQQPARSFKQNHGLEPKTWEIVWNSQVPVIQCNCQTEMRDSCVLSRIQRSNYRASSLSSISS